MLASLDPTTRVVMVIVVLASLYVLSGLLWPHTACPACQDGRRFSPTGQNWRACRRCDGTGQRTRLISRVLGRGDE